MTIFQLLLNISVVSDDLLSVVALHNNVVSVINDETIFHVVLNINVVSVVNI